MPPNRRISPTPPLRVWGAVAIIVLVACLLAVPPFLRYRAGIEKEFLRICSDRIAAFTARCAAGSGTEPRIIAIGGSLLICAVPIDGEMENLARREGYGDIRFLSLPRIQSNIDHFLPVMDKVVAARPDILLIESDIFLYRRKTVDIPTSLEKYGEFCRNGIKDSLLRSDYHRRQSRNDQELKSLLGAGILDAHPARNAQFLRSYSKYIANREPRENLSRGDPILSLLKQARDRGIRVVLLDLPRSRQADTIIPAPHRRKTGELQRQMEQECGVRILGFPYRFPLEMYRDYSHLTEPGAEQYSRWLIARTAEMVAGKGRR